MFFPKTMYTTSFLKRKNLYKRDFTKKETSLNHLVLQLGSFGGKTNDNCLFVC